MTLKEFYAQIGGNYEDTLHRLPSEALVHRFVLKYPPTRAWRSCATR